MQIADRHTVKQILSGINQIQWSGAYKPALSQVHDHMLQQEPGTPARKSLSLIKDFSTRLRVNRIIKAIGLENFVGSSANEVLSALDSVYTERSDSGMDRGQQVTPRPRSRLRSFDPSEQSTSTYVGQEAPEQAPEVEEEAPVEPGESEEDAAEMAQQEEESEKSRLEVAREKAEAYRSAPFPAWRTRLVETQFKNMGILFSNIDKYYTPYNKDPDPVLDTIDGWFADFDKYLAETAPPEAPKPAEKKTRRVRKFQSTLDQDDDANLEEENKKASSLEDGAALSADFLSGVPAFISLREDGVPTFNVQAIDTAYAALSEKLQALKVETENAAPGRKKQGGKYSKAFNEIFHSIKVKDWETRTFIIDNEAQIRQALGGASDYDRFKREANKYYLSSRLKDDMSLFQDIYWALAYCISYSLFGHIQNTKPVTFRTGAGTSLDQGSIDMDELRERYLSRAMERIRAKYFMVFDISSPKFFRTRTDTIAELKVQTGMLIKRTFRQLHGAQAGNHTVYFRKSLCPVCFKEIRWSRPEALKGSDEFRDFEVPTVVPFDIGRGVALTEEVMEAGGPYDPPEGLRGRKTWSDIKGLIASNKVATHREGWVRRAAALMSMGGEHVGSTNITKSMFRCPYPTERSSCGISLNPLTQEESLLPPAPGKLATIRDKIDYAREIIGTDPSKVDRPTYEATMAMIDPITRDQFAGDDEYREIKRGLRLMRSKVSETIGYGGLTQPGWTPSSLQTNNGSLKSRISGTEAKLQDRMTEQAAGGYKFSSSTFRCPCHITPDIIKNTQSGGHVKHTHFTYAMPYAGLYNPENEDQVLPTSPSGDPSGSVQEGSFGYLVCGAQTSLSAFDRDMTNESGFISMMKSIYVENQNLFLSLVEYFLKEGVDVSDIMSVLPYVSSGREPEDIESTAEIDRIRNRVEKLAKLFSEGMARQGDELFDRLKEFILVCPFGHRFKIEDSLRFGEAHSSMSLRNEKMSAYSDIVRGKSQSWEYLVAKGNLIKVDPNSARNYQYYGEWSLAPSSSRVLSIFNIQSKLAKLGADERYDLIRSLTFLKFQGPDGDYAFSDSIRLAQQAWTGVGNAQPLYTSLDFVSGGPREVSDIQLDGQSSSPSGSATAKQYRQEAFAIDNADSVVPIPGSDTLDDADWDEYVDSKRLSLARAIRSVLNIITVWNNGIVNDDMARIFTIKRMHQYDLDSAVTTALTALSAMPGMNADTAEAWAAENAETLKTMIEENVETFGVIKPSDTSRDVAVQILSDAIHRFMTDTEAGQAGMSQPRKATRAVRKEAPRIAESVVQGNQELIAYLASSEHGGQKLVRSSHREKYIQKMFLVAYSSHLATSLANIAQDYFVDGSDRYIGYDIGLDLTDYEANMRITDAQLGALEDTANTALEDYSVFGNPMSTSGPEDHTNRIDKAYLRLIHITNWGNRFALSASNLEKAKQFVSDTLAGRGDETSEWFRGELDKFFPIAKMDLAHSHSSVWMGRRVPITGTRGGHQILDMPDTRFPNGTRIVNPSINFDSSKIQIGMIAPRPSKEPETGGKAEAQLWPPKKQGYAGGGFVGLTIPVRKGTSINTEAGSVELKVLSHSVVVDMGGEPVDISFLFQRGFTPEDYQALERVEGLIDEAEEQYSRAIEQLGRDLKGEEYETQAAALKDAHQLRLTELRGRREEVPLRYRTDTTSYYFNPRAGEAELPLLPEEDFKSKFAVPAKKRTYEGYPGHRKTEVAEIVPRVLEMYSRFNKTQDPTIAQMIKDLTNKLARYKAEKQSTEVSLMITDPIQAFRLINSTALTGNELSEERRAKLIEFVMDIYGGWRVLEIAQRIQSERDVGKSEDERLGPVTVEELLTMRRKDGTMWSDEEIGELNRELRKGNVGDSEGWANHTGNYYDIYQGGEGEEDTGSHLQYVYGIHTEKNLPALRPPVDGIPNIGDIRDVKAHSALYGLEPARRQKKQRGRRPDPAKVAKLMANRTRSSMLRYIQDSTSGASQVRPSVTRENEIIDKISKRRNNVAGIIIDSRIEDLLPNMLVEEAMLEVYYDNIIHNR